MGPCRPIYLTKSRGDFLIQDKKYCFIVNRSILAVSKNSIWAQAFH